MTNLFWNPGIQNMTAGPVANLTHRAIAADGILFGTDAAGSEFESYFDSDRPDDSVPGSLAVRCTTASSVASGADRHLRIAVYGKKLFPVMGHDLRFKCAIRRKGGAQSIAVTNETRTRTYIAEQLVADDAWDELDFIVPFSTATGTWNYGDGYGIGFRIALVVGSAYQGATGAWLEANKTGSENQSNLGSTVGDTLKITKIQIDTGSGDFVLPDSTTVSVESSREMMVIDHGFDNSGGLGVNIWGVAVTESWVNFDIPLNPGMYAPPEVSISGVVNTDWNLQSIAGTDIPTASITSYGRSRNLAKFSVFASGSILTPGAIYSLRLKTTAAKLIINGHMA